MTDFCVVPATETLRAVMVWAMAEEEASERGRLIRCVRSFAALSRQPVN